MQIPNAMNPHALGLKSFLDDQTDYAAAVRGIGGVLHGPPGVGKTTLLCHSPSCALLPDPIDAGAIIAKKTNTIPKEVRILRAPQDWSQLLFALEEFADRSHGYRNLVIDNMTGFQTLLFTHTKEQCKIADDYDFFNYQKGPKIAAARFVTPFTTRLGNILAKGINVWLISHTRIGQRPSPSAKEAQAFVPTIDRDVWDVLKAWAELILFEHFDLSTERLGMRDKTKATGARTIYTKDTGWAEAKSWLDIPSLIMLPGDPKGSWEKLAEQLRKVGRLNDAPVSSVLPSALQSRRPVSV